MSLSQLSGSRVYDGSSAFTRALFDNLGIWENLVVNDSAFVIPNGRTFAYEASVNMIRVIDDLYIWRFKPQL